MLYLANKRFGISLLSKKNRNIAFLEEVMIDKETGEVLVKTPEGDIISYNFNSRIKSHIIEARADADNMNVYGNIYNIEFNNVSLPSTLLYNTEYVTTPIELATKCRKLLIHLDIDPITINTDDISYIRNNLLVDIKLELVFNDNTVSPEIVISKSINTLNTFVFDIYNIANYREVKNIRVTSFQFKDQRISYDDRNIDNSNDKIRTICNSIFFIIGT